MEAEMKNKLRLVEVRSAARLREQRNAMRDGGVDVAEDSSAGSQSAQRFTLELEEVRSQHSRDLEQQRAAFDEMATLFKASARSQERQHTLMYASLSQDLSDAKTAESAQLIDPQSAASRIGDLEERLAAAEEAHKETLLSFLSSQPARGTALPPAAAAAKTSLRMNRHGSIMIA
jgi:hypothetical protein